MIKSKVSKPRNSGKWSEARFHAFIVSALRKAQWGPKYDCIKKAFKHFGVNPATGRGCGFYSCAKCSGEFMQKDMSADHIEPVVAVEGFSTWEVYISRLFVEIDGFQALCGKCHSIKTECENALRKSNKKTNPAERILL